MSAVKPMPRRLGVGVSMGVEHVGGLSGAVLGEGPLELRRVFDFDEPV